VKQFINRLPAPAILIAMPILSVIVGAGLFIVVLLVEQRGVWRQLDTPPGEVTRLLTADEDVVYVETADGTVYRVMCRAKGPDDICWEETEAPPDDLVLPCTHQELPPPPGPTRDHIETCFEYEYYILAQYALLEDGTLWRWNAGIYPLGQVARLFRTVIGSAVLGVIAGIGILYWRGPQHGPG
jgi:hypothetical protein